jgi:anti-sigma factor RsiW
MNEFSNGSKQNCEWFLNELEELPQGGSRATTVEALLSKMPEEARRHAARCGECASALEDFAAIRRALEQEPESLVKAGPWFTQKVMHAIALQEAEIEERQSGFWNGVRRLAPRLVALATLLLMIGGTWAFQERRAAPMNGPEARQTEGIFESTPSAPANDDVIVSVHQEKLP